MKRIKCLSALLTLTFLFCVGNVNAQKTISVDKPVDKKTLKLERKAGTSAKKATAVTTQKKATNKVSTPKPKKIVGQPIPNADQKTRQKKEVLVSHGAPVNELENNIDIKINEPKIELKGANERPQVTNTSKALYQSRSQVKTTNNAPRKAKGSNVSFDATAYEAARNQEIAQILATKGYSNLSEFKQNDKAGYSAFSQKLYELRQNYIK